MDEYKFFVSRRDRDENHFMIANGSRLYPPTNPVRAFLWIENGRQIEPPASFWRNRVTHL